MSNPRDRWLNRELRKVRLPVDLVARLKEICRGSDSDLDAAIADVDLPDGLLARLKAVPADLKLDHALTDVSTPATLLASLREIPEYGDVHLDAELSDVPVPAGLTASLRSIAGDRQTARPSWGRMPAVQWAVAASLMLGAGLSLLAGLRSVAVAVYLKPATLDPELTTSSPLELDLTLATPQFEAPRAPSVAADVVAVSPAITMGADLPSDVWMLQGPLPRGTTAEIDWLFARRGADADPLLDVFLNSTNLFAFEVSDSQYELQTVAGLTPRGLEPPRTKGYDLLSLLRTGIHPFVSPEASGALTECQAPLVTQTDSYLRAWTMLAQGRLPEAEQVRVEEFLAAIDYNLPPPTEQSLGIRTAAGPSPFGEEDMSLLQVGVQARGTSGDHRPTLLTLAVDISGSMDRRGANGGPRLDAIRRGVGRLAQQLGPHDRLSVVVFSEHAEVLIEGASREEAAEVVATLRAISPRGATNIAAGLQVATAAAMGAEVEPGTRRRVVLVTDDLGDLPASSVARLTEFIQSSAQSQVGLDVIDVAAHGEPSAADKRLARLAQAGGGAVYRAEGADAIRFAALEILTGQSPVVAVDARLSVQFNPRAVQRYRLLGHEADAVGGMVAGKLGAVLRAGEAATALFELELNPKGGDEIATAELVWTDPASGEENRIGPQRISRLQFATSILESPLSLQRAAIAAETAEVLRLSTFAPAPLRGLRQILERSADLHPRALGDPSMAEMLTFVRQAERVRTGKPVDARSGPLFWVRPR
jgi:Ca-activated chloride channel family protein